MATFRHFIGSVDLRSGSAVGLRGLSCVRQVSFPLACATLSNPEALGLRSFRLNNEEG